MKKYILGNGFLISSWLLMGFYQFWTQTLLKQNLLKHLPFSIKSIYVLLMPSNSKTEMHFLFLVREDWANTIWVWDIFNLRKYSVLVLPCHLIAPNCLWIFRISCSSWGLPLISFPFFYPTGAQDHLSPFLSCHLLGGFAFGERRHDFCLHYV